MQHQAVRARPSQSKDRPDSGGVEEREVGHVEHDFPRAVQRHFSGFIEPLSGVHVELSAEKQTVVVVVNWEHLDGQPSPPPRVA